VIAYKVQLDLWEPGAHTGTFRGNQLAMAAGYATFKFMSESNILDHVQTISARLQDRLASLQKNYPCVGDIRGRGLMLGIEIVDPHKNTDALGSFPPDPFKAQLLQKYCFDSKMIIERGGRNGSVLRFLPPLTLSFQDADLIIERLSNSLEKIANNALEAAIDG
jgi:diaminobutyrate-2-oxoglutarate transaminase